MKIIVDAMGGDNAPLAIVKGALDAGKEHWGVEVLLVGRRRGHSPVRWRTAATRHLPAGVEIVHATEVVEMCDDPATAFQAEEGLLPDAWA